MRVTNKKTSWFQKALAWWKNRETHIQTTLLAGLFTLTAAFCSSIAVVASLYPYFEEKSEPSLPNHQIVDRLALDSGNDVIQTEVRGRSYDVVPTRCHSVVGYEQQYGESYTFQAKIFPTVNLSFIIISDKPILISDVSVVVEHVQFPPQESEIIHANVPVFPPGVGTGGFEVPDIILPHEPIINRSLQRTSLSQRSVYKLETSNDQLKFVGRLTFSDPGLYLLHIEAEAKSFDGSTKIYTSDPLTYGWLPIADFSGIDTGNIKLETCN